MKKRLIALCLSVITMMSVITLSVVAGEINPETSDVTTTEATTVEPTTAEITTTEPTTSTATTTTKSSTSDVNENIDITLQLSEIRELYSYVSNNLSAGSYTWKSSDENIAKISSSGKITSNVKGSCTITATGSSSGTSYNYTFNITVYEPSATKTYSVKTYVDDTVNLYSEMSNTKVKAAKYTWISESTKYATVSSSGVVTGKKVGTSKVTAYYSDDDNTYYYVFNVTVKEGSNTTTTTSTKASIKTSWTIYMGSNDKLDISNLLEDNPSDYKWSVSDEGVVTVSSSSAQLTAEDDGTAKVTAKGSENYTFTVKVDDRYSSESISVKSTNTVNLNSVLNEDVGEYKFTSDRTSVATVSGNGKVTGVANGVGSIICEHEDGDIVQVFVTVSGAVTITTTEKTTETTTMEKTTTKATTTTLAMPEFSDISGRTWAVSSIKAMAAKGFIVGRNANTFAPDDTCTRADFAIVLTKIFGFNSQVTVDNYEDVLTGDYYYNYVGTAKTLGLEAGVTNNLFRPKYAVTREEIMVMVYKAMLVNNTSVNTDISILNKFSDTNVLNAENKIAVAALVNAGIVTGTSDTALELDANITRAQMAVLLNNVYNML